MTAAPRQPQRLRGRIVTGRGDFAYWMTLLSDLYAQKTGMRLFPGTLNVELGEEWSIPRQRAIRIEKEEYGGRVSVSLVRCRIFDRDAFILRTDANEDGSGHHSRNIIELATDVKLRDTYSLVDGCEVEVEVEL